MRPILLVCTEIPSLPGPLNPFLMNALKPFYRRSLKAQSRCETLEAATQPPSLQSGRRRCRLHEGGLCDPPNCPS